MYKGHKKGGKVAPTKSEQRTKNRNFLFKKQEH
jgi:hypothetical protein